MPIKKIKTQPRLPSRNSSTRTVIDTALHLAYYGAHIRLPIDTIPDPQTFKNRAKDCGYEVKIDKTWIVLEGVKRDYSDDSFLDPEDLEFYADEIPEE